VEIVSLSSFVSRSGFDETKARVYPGIGDKEMASTTAEKNRVRSPSFPFISLREAVERARVFFREEKQHSAPPEVALSYWGYSSLKSSGGPRTIAALRSYGLLEGDDEVRLTDRAIVILQEQAWTDVRAGILREVALLPAVHRVLWDKLKADLPSDATLGHFLIEELSFNPDAVAGFLRNYRDTLAFARLDSDSPPQREKAAAPPPPPPPPPRSAPERPAASADLTLRFPLLDGNQVELRVARKVPPQEAEQLRRLFDLWIEKIVER
jgi:hypothetical protein